MAEGKSSFPRDLSFSLTSFCKSEDEFRKTSIQVERSGVIRSKGRMIPSRYIIVILGFFSCIVINAQRLNLSMALVAMVNQTALFQNSGTNVSECTIWSAHEDTNAEIHSVTEGQLMWDSETQNHIIGAGFLGFVLTNILGGRLSETLGAKQTLIFSLACASFSNILSPLASSWGAYAFLGIQLIKGLSQGLTQPAISYIMAQWYPKPEKGFLSSVTFSGYPAGAVVGGLLSGAICDSSILGGWPLVFYLFGFTGLLLTIFIYWYSANSPEMDDFISNEELKYIISHREITTIETTPVIPWKPMMSSPATWALFIGMFGQYWMTFYFLSVHPTYLATVLHFTNTESGYLNSAPYIGQIIVTWISSYVSDWIVNKNYATTTTVRKVCNSLSCLGFSLSLIGVASARCNHVLNVILFVIAISMVGFGYPGCCIVPIDMSQLFVGTLMGVTCTVASTSGFIIPLIVGSLTNNQQSLHQWGIVLYISAGVGLISGIIFHVFGSASLQEWDSPENESKKEGLVNEAFEQAPDSSSRISIIRVSSTNLYDNSSILVEKL